MRNPSEATADPVFVVVLREWLVAQDVEMTIRSIAPDAQVILARSIEEGLAAAPAGKIRAVFVQIEAERFAQSDLGRRVAEDGGLTVLVGMEAALQLPDGYAELPFPFAEQDVKALLCRDDAGRCALSGSAA